MSTPTSPTSPSTTAPPAAPPAAAPVAAAPPTSPRLLDLVVQALWLMAQEVYRKPELASALHMHAPSLAYDLKHASQSGALAETPPLTFDSFAALDTLARMGVELAFPYPSSPRLDGVGGGSRRIAPDGSPGIPAAWLRWMTQARVYDERRDRTAPHAPLLLAVAWLMQHEPELWRLYAAAVIEGRSARAIAASEGLAVAVVYRRLARARTLLLAQISYFTGVATVDEYEAMLSLITPNAAAETPSINASAEQSIHSASASHAR